MMIIFCLVIFGISISTVFNQTLSLFKKDEKVSDVVKGHEIQKEKQNKNKDKSDMLTQREMDVARLVAQGKSNKDICNILFLTEGTVKNYLTKIFEKLELTSRTELALFINQS